MKVLLFLFSIMLMLSALGCSKNTNKEIVQNIPADQQVENSKQLQATQRQLGETIDTLAYFLNRGPVAYIVEDSETHARHLIQELGKQEVEGKQVFVQASNTVLTDGTTEGNPLQILYDINENGDVVKIGQIDTNGKVKWQTPTIHLLGKMQVNKEYIVDTQEFNTSYGNRKYEKKMILLGREKVEILGKQLDCIVLLTEETTPNLLENGEFDTTKNLLKEYISKEIGNVKTEFIVQHIKNNSVIAEETTEKKLVEIHDRNFLVQINIFDYLPLDQKISYDLIDNSGQEVKIEYLGKKTIQNNQVYVMNDGGTYRLIQMDEFGAFQVGMMFPKTDTEAEMVDWFQDSVEIFPKPYKFEDLVINGQTFKNCLVIERDGGKYYYYKGLGLVKEVLNNTERVFLRK